jgi:hypothetical protein
LASLSIFAAQAMTATIGGNYAGITVEDIRTCLAYVKEVLQLEGIFPIGQPRGMRFLANEKRPPGSAAR